MQIIISMKLSKEQYLVFSLVLLKLIIHLFTLNNYELQRDAYLYYTLGENPDWGFISVPPLIAVISKLSTSIFGNTVFALRLFPALIGGLSVWLIAKFVKELKGSILAVALACLAFILSPAFLRSNSLFQPVSFNQFFWLLSFYLLLKMINRQDPKFWIWIMITWGFAFLNKYSIAFIILATLAGLLLTKHRKLYLSKYFILGGMVGILIILPNLVWQYKHNWPVVSHMAELARYQLVHVTVPGFLIDQVLMNFPALAVWVTGLVLILFNKTHRDHLVFGYIYLFTVTVLLLTSGKSYYTLGLYTMLFAFGGLSIDLYFRKWMKIAVLALMPLLLLPMLPVSLPLLKYERLEAYTKPMANFVNRWEDGNVYNIPQDYADMTGWKELSEIVIPFYSSLNDSIRSECLIYGENYGHAASLYFYGKKHGLPQPLSFNDSFILWAPDSIDNVPMIYVNHEIGDLDELYGSVKLVGVVGNPYFRENGLKVYYCSEPLPLLKPFYAEKVAELKARYQR